MRIIKDINELEQNLDPSRKLILYGAGWAGKTICKFLKANKVPISAFAVTSLNEAKETEGIPVYAIDDILQCYSLDEIYFILAITKTYYSVIEKELESRKVTSYLAFSDLLIYKMAAENRKLDAEKSASRKYKKDSCIMIGYLTPGYLDSNYAEKRLVIDKIEGVSYIEIPKETHEFTCMDSEYEECPDIYRQILEACYTPDRYIPNVELIHTFNAVCNTDKPWCASFETAIPRMRCETKNEETYFRQLVDYMKRPNCRALYALCQNAYKIQKNSLKIHSVPAQDIELLMKKTKVLHPPQEILITESGFKKKHDTKKFILFLLAVRFSLRVDEKSSRFFLNLRTYLTLI